MNHNAWIYSDKTPDKNGEPSVSSNLKHFIIKDKIPNVASKENYKQFRSTNNEAYNFGFRTHK